MENTAQVPLSNNPPLVQQPTNIPPNNLNTAMPTQNPLPPKNTSLLAPVLACLALLFIIIACAWLFFSPSTKKKALLPSQVVTPTIPLSPTVTTTPSQSPTASLTYLSQELSSGDLKRISAVTSIDATHLSASASAQLLQVKKISFDLQTFQIGSDQQHANVQGTIEYKNGKKIGNQPFPLILKNGRWVVGLGN